MLYLLCVFRNHLKRIFDSIVEVDGLDSMDAAHLALLKRPELGITFTKLHCWKLTQYEKCVFMDADMLVCYPNRVLIQRKIPTN